MDGWQAYLLFSGASQDAGGATFRLKVDPALREISGPLEVILRAECRGSRPDDGRACTAFDSDYAGAGTVFPCPSGQTLYFYHGENHTAPDAKRARPASSGWTGISQAVWDPQRRAFRKDGRIAGRAISKRWENSGSTWRTRQTPATSGNPGVVPDPSFTFLYLYFANRSDAPDATGPDAQCDTRTCWAVARADQADVCRGQ